MLLFFKTLITTQARRGVTAVETVVGVSLITVVLLFAISAIGQFIKSGSVIVEKTQALYLTEEVLESVRYVRDTKWSDFQALALDTDLYIDRSGGALTITTTPQAVGIFTPKFRLYAVNRDAVTHDIVSSGGSGDSGTRLVVATTSWSGGSVGLSAYITYLNP